MTPPPLPPPGPTVGDLVIFADAVVARMEQANGRTADTIGIVERCEQRDAAATQRRKFLGIF